MTSRSILVAVAMALPALVTGLAAGCGSDVVVLAPGAGDEDGGAGGYLFIDAKPPDADAPPVDGAQDAFEEYVDPGCGDKPPPIENYACDPYKQQNGDCADGEACYIYVKYPSEPCGQEEYGAYCYPAGPGQQGDGCNGGFDCGAGLVCVITGSGTQCVELCNLVGPDGCPPGLVCEPIDVKGFGGCL